MIAHIKNFFGIPDGFYYYLHNYDLSLDYFDKKTIKKIYRCSYLYRDRRLVGDHYIVYNIEDIESCKLSDDEAILYNLL